MTCITSGPTPSPRQEAPPVRLSLIRPDTGPHQIDGAWWPRSRDLTEELPPLLTALNHRWGCITRVTADSSMWLASPRRIALADRVVHLNWSSAGGRRRTICLLSLGIGRVDLLVIPPGTAATAAQRLMSSAVDPYFWATASNLVETGEARTGGNSAQWSSPPQEEGVWESEGGAPTRAGPTPHNNASGTR
jgi:hypothetical protein